MKSQTTLYGILILYIMLHYIVYYTNKIQNNNNNLFHN